jgi:hypothetical protein
MLKFNVFAYRMTTKVREANYAQRGPIECSRTIERGIKRRGFLEATFEIIEIWLFV